MTSGNRGCEGYLFDSGINSEPVLISACLLGIPCRWHGRKPKRRDKLIERLKKRYVLAIGIADAFGRPRNCRRRRRELAKNSKAAEQRFSTADCELSHQKRERT